MKLKENYWKIYSIILEYFHNEIDVDTTLQDLEIFLNESSFCIDDEFIDYVFKNLNSNTDLEKISYHIDNEDYWLDASESIWVKYLTILYGDHIELYKIELDELYGYHGITKFIQILLYSYEAIQLRKLIKEFLPYNSFE